MQHGTLPADLDYHRSNAELEQWAANYVQPLTRALYASRLDEARRLHQIATAALEQAGLAEEVQEALGYHLLFIHYNIYWQAEPAEWNPANYREVKLLFEQPALTSFGDIERVKRLMMIRYHADQDQYDLLTHESLMRLLDDLHGYPDDTTWFYAAGWAFRHSDLPLLERAYVETLVDPARWMGQAKWQRINMMYLLAAGRATRRDVHETIKSLAILPQLLEFEGTIWPRCREADLVDAELTELLAQRAAYIREQVPLPPGREQRTKRLRRDKE
jgi:hypothetical protein